MAPKLHATVYQSYAERAEHSNLAPLAEYLLHLMAIKKSNLCLSADVSSTAELLRLAEEVGDSICILKTHADIVNDFGDRTIQRLTEVAKRRHFLIFEDRKFGDIGSRKLLNHSTLLPTNEYVDTVQQQYTQGPLRIATWASLTNAHIFPGPGVITALQAAAARVLSSHNSSVRTHITASPLVKPVASDDDVSDQFYNSLQFSSRNRLGSIHSIETTTTIETYTEPLSPMHSRRESGRGIRGELEGLGDAPFDRGLLLLAEMSSEGSLMTGDYTRRCVGAARQYRDFVVGFIAQRCLNEAPGDTFITMTPGVSLPPANGASRDPGDGLGQQYNTPKNVILEKGSDVIIVGRGILKADNPQEEAERYRRAGWDAYEQRIALKK